MEEEEPKQKSEEKNDEETANTKDDTEGRQEGDGKPSDTEVSSAAKKDEMSETNQNCVFRARSAPFEGR